MPRNEVMRHMLDENVGVVIGRQGLAVGDNQLWNLVTISRALQISISFIGEAV